MVRVARNLTRKSLALLTSLLLLLFWVPGLIAASPAYATDPGFEIDGNVIPAGGLDWNNVTTSPNYTVVHDNVPSDITSFGSTNKESDPPNTWINSGAGAQHSDVVDVFTYTHNSSVVVNNVTRTDAFLDFAFTRNSPDGTDGYFIELDKNGNLHHTLAGHDISYPDRSGGAVRFQMKEQGNASMALLDVSQWNTSTNAWEAPTTVDTTGFDSAVSTSAVNPPDSGTFPADGFIEVSLDLTKLVGVTPDCPPPFGYVNFRSYTGNSDKNLQDYVDGFKAPAASTCSSLTLVKRAQAAPQGLLGGATFRIAPNPFTRALSSYIDVTDNTTANDHADPNDSNGSVGTVLVTGVKPGPYTVTEQTAPPGYLLATPRTTPPFTALASTPVAAITFYDPLGSLTFHKVDGDHVALGGAQFRVHPESAGTDTSKDILVTDDGTNDAADAAALGNASVGTIKVTGLKTGTYDITEEHAPNGYVKDTSTKTATIADPQLDPANDANPEISLAHAFVDPKATLTVWKYHTETNQTKTNIPGAVFNLYGSATQVALGSFDPTSATLVGSCTTATSGLCTVPTDSPAGEAGSHLITWDNYYYWVEQSVPWPYAVPAGNVFGPVHITEANVGDVRNPTPADDPKALLTTTATATATLPLAAGTGIKDTAHLSGVNSSSNGAIVFNAYGPNPSSCTGTPAFTSTKSATSGAGDYDSDTFTPTDAGTYKWSATYYPNGTSDTTHVVAADCNDATELSTVSPATPEMNTVATDATTVLGTFHDAAYLRGLTAPSGTHTLSVTFTLYPTSNCARGTDLFTSTNDVVFDTATTGHTTSGDYTATNARGTYYWKATLNLNGDTNNTTTGIGNDCGLVTPDPNGNHEVSTAPVLLNPVKSPASGTVRVYDPSNTITYTVTLQNTGGNTAVGTTVTDPIDAGATFKSNDSCVFSLPAPGQDQTCSFVQDPPTTHIPTWTFDLAAGGSVTIQFTVTAKSADADGQHIFNKATAHSGTKDLDSNVTDHTVIRPLLALEKNADPLPVEDATPTSTGTVAPGQTITYTLPLSNTGSDAANGVVVTDQVPAHTSYSPGSAHCESDISTHATLTCTSGDSGASPDVVTWTVDVPAHTTVYVVFAAVVDAKASTANPTGVHNGDSIPNQGHFTWNYSATSHAAGTYNLSGDSRSIHHVVTFPIISAAKTATPDWIENGASGVVTPGGPIHYVVTVHNSGQADATGVTVSDLVPPGTTYYPNSAVPAAVPDAQGILHWTISVAAGKDTQVAFDVTVNANDTDGQLIHNTAVVAGVDTNTTSHIVETPIMSVAKTSVPTSGADAAHPKLVDPNTVITYTLTVTNAGRYPKSGFVVTDSVPTGTTYRNDASCNGAANCTVQVNGGVITWTLDVPGGSVTNNVVTPTTRTLTFSVLTPTVQSFLIDNTASYPNDHTPGCTTQSCFTETTHHKVVYPVIEAHKSSIPASGADAAHRATVLPGQAITYTIAVTNTGEAKATGVVVHDSVPANTTYVVGSADATGGGESAGVITWTTDVDPHATVYLTFQARVPTGATNGTTVDNTATFSNVHTANCIAAGQGECSTETTYHMVRFPITTASKAATPDWIENGASGVVRPGIDTIHYVVTVHNGGLANATGVTVTDAIPAGTTYVADSAVPLATPDSNNVLSWTVDVAAGGDTQVSFDVKVDANDADGQLIHNTATFTNMHTPNCIASGLTDCSTNTTSHIAEIPIMSVAKTSSPASGADELHPTLVDPQSVITYTLTVTNAGRYAAPGFVVTDAVPTGTTYNSNSASCNGAANCTVQVSGGVITWTLDVPGGTVTEGVVTPTTRTLTFSVTTPTQQSFLIKNTAHFPNIHTQNCETQTCDTTTTYHEVVFPVINAVKTSDPASGTQANPATVTPGQVITYTVAVTNSGEADAKGLVVHDSVPANTTYVAGSADATGGSLSGGVVTWTVNVPKHTTVNVTFQAQVVGGATNGTLVDNTATFTNVHTPSCTGETCSTNTTHHEVRFPILTLAKSSNPVSGSIVQRGDRIDYTITLANSGLDASAPTTITDTLPTNVTIVSGSASPAFTTVNGGVVTWTVTVPAGQTKTLTYGVTVNSDAPEGATLTNVALVNGQCVGNADASACTTDHHVPTGALTLVKHVDKATANYGDTLTYTFDAATTGALDQTGVVVTDVLPAGTAYVSGSAGCTDSGTCTASFDATSKTVTWRLGDMAAGATRHLVFKVTIVKPSFNSTTGLPPTTIVNSGAVQSNETPKTPSNQVVTKVVAVLGVKVVRPPVLAFTGLPAQVLLTMGLLMLGAGIILTSVRRKEQ